jgi:hypothetical protein
VIAGDELGHVVMLGLLRVMLRRHGSSGHLRRQSVAGQCHPVHADFCGGRKCSGAKVSQQVFCVLQQRGCINFCTWSQLFEQSPILFLKQSFGLFCVAFFGADG